MKRNRKQQGVLIVKRQNCKSFVATVRKVRPIFCRNNVQNSSTVNRINKNSKLLVDLLM